MKRRENKNKTYLSVTKLKSSIETKQEIQNATLVLKELENKSIKEPCIASSYTRGFLTGTKPSDIDIAYIGNIHYTVAQKYLSQVLKKLGINDQNWDVTGIWNAQIAHPEITSTEMNYLLFYVNSIDSIYLASDGKLHDPTGFGFQDSITKTLRMNDFTKMDFRYLNKDVVYLCLEGCRRIAKFNWNPTQESIELIKYGIPLWNKLENTEKEYFYNKKILSKYNFDQLSEVEKIYDKYGWGFVVRKAKK